MRFSQTMLMRLGSPHVELLEVVYNAESDSKKKRRIRHRRFCCLELFITLVGI